MTITLRARGIELTPAIHEYVEEKFQSLEKFEAKISIIDVTVGMEPHHHTDGNVFRCQARVQVPGDLLVVEKEEQDLYKAIDKVKDHLKELLADRNRR